MSDSKVERIDAEKYKKYNFISKDDNSDFELNIPVLNKNEFKIYIEEIINKSIDDFSNKFKSELEELYINLIKPPKHLTKKIIKMLVIY